MIEFVRRLNSRQLFGLSAAVFFLWFIGAAVVYYQERVFYIDSAAQLFEMLLSKNFEIYVSRYSMFLSQLLPLSLIKLHAPLFMVAIGYSVSMPIITCIAFYLCLFRWKNFEASFAILLSAALAQHTFFHAISETMLLVPYAGMFYAACAHQLEEKRTRLLGYLGAVSFLLLAFFIHPVSVFFIAFVLWILWLQKGRLAFHKLWPYALVFIGLFVGKMLMSKFSDATAHDDGFISQLADNVKDIGLLWSFPSTISFRHLVKPMLWPVVLVFFVGLIWGVYKKKWLYTLGSVAFTCLFFITSLLIYRAGDSLIGMERAFLPLAFFTAILFATLVLKKRGKVLYFVLPVVLSVFSYLGVKRALPEYKLRLQEMSHFLAEVQTHEGQKFYAKFGSTAESSLFSSWALSIESLLLAETHYDKSVVLFGQTDFLDPLLILENEPAFPFTSFQTLMYDDQVNRSNYFNIKGKVYPFIDASEKYMFSGVKNPLGVYCSDGKEVMSKSGDNWQGKTLQIESSNPYQNIVAYSLSPKSSVTFTADVSTGATIVIDAGKSAFVQETNNLEGWNRVEVVYQAPDTAVNVTLYVYNGTDTLVYAKNLIHSIHVPE